MSIHSGSVGSARRRRLAVAAPATEQCLAFGWPPVALVLQDSPRHRGRQDPPSCVGSRPRDCLLLEPWKVILATPKTDAPLRLQARN